MLKNVIPLLTSNGVIDVNAKPKGFESSEMTSLDESSPIYWSEGNFNFTLEQDKSCLCEKLTIEVYQFENPVPLFKIECEKISPEQLSELIPLGSSSLAKFNDSQIVTPHSVKMLFEKLLQLGLTPKIHNKDNELMHNELFLLRYDEIMSRPYRWEGAFAFDMTANDSPFTREDKFTHDLYGNTKMVVLVSTSLSSLNSRERDDTVSELLHVMEKLGSDINTDAHRLRRSIAEKIIDCRFTQRDDEGGILRFRINLYLDSQSDQLFIIYDPWICSTSRKYPVDGSLTMSELLRAITSESSPLSGRDLYLEILDRVALSNESVSRAYQDALKRIEESLVNEDSHPSPNIHMNAMNALTYILSRTEIAANSLKNCHEQEDKESQKILKLISRFQRVQENIRTILNGHQTKIDLADVIATRRETSERHNSDDIIRGGTVGILGGTFTLVVWEMSHYVALAGTLAALSSLVIVGYGAKIFTRSRKHGHSLIDSIKKIF